MEIKGWESVCPTKLEHNAEKSAVQLYHTTVAVFKWKWFRRKTYMRCIYCLQEWPREP